MDHNQLNVDKVRMKIRELNIKYPELFGLIDFRNVNVTILSQTKNAFASEDRSSDIISISEDLLRDPDEFEAVLAHELTHVQKKHHNIRPSERYALIGVLLAIASFVAFFIFSITSFIFYVAVLALLARCIILHEKFGSTKALNYHCEYEADRAAAKVNKKGLESILLKIKDVQDSQTHPGLEKRLKNIKSDLKF